MTGLFKFWNSGPIFFLPAAPFYVSAGALAYRLAGGPRPFTGPLGLLAIFSVLLFSLAMITLSCWLLARAYGYMRGPTRVRPDAAGHRAIHGR